MLRDNISKKAPHLDHALGAKFVIFPRKCPPIVAFGMHTVHLIRRCVQCGQAVDTRVKPRHSEEMVTREHNPSFYASRADSQKCRTDRYSIVDLKRGGQLDWQGHATSERSIIWPRQ
jgi:hypothetical protein